MRLKILLYLFVRHTDMPLEHVVAARLARAPGTKRVVSQICRVGRCHPQDARFRDPAGTRGPVGETAALCARRDWCHVQLVKRAAVLRIMCRASGVLFGALDADRT